MLEIARAINTIPENFNAHKRVRKIFEERLQSIEKGKSIDWATAETLACASLLKEGFGVRLSGQDSGRGTFGHRHAVLYDQVDE